MKKVRVIVSHNDRCVTSDISNVINNLDYAEVVGTANSGIETYNKIIEIKPKVVFVEYNYSDMTGLDIIKKTKEQLSSEMPDFNMIINNEITDSQVDAMYDEIGKKLNALVTEPSDVIDIMKGYK